MSRDDRKRGGVEEHLSLAEAAERLGISERTARRWIKSGKLRAYKPGRDYWIRESALTDLVEESEVSPKAGRSSLEPSLFNGLGDERLSHYQHSWRDYITHRANQISSQADSKGYAPEWMLEIASLPREITRALFDNGVLGKRETYPTEAEWRQSWEIFDALDVLNQAVEQAWRAQMRESEQLERQREAAAELDSAWKRINEGEKRRKKELEAIRNERRESA
jgi:excisionase family DNA binding protein